MNKENINVVFPRYQYSKTTASVNNNTLIMFTDFHFKLHKRFLKM